MAKSGKAKPKERQKVDECCETGGLQRLCIKALLRPPGPENKEHELLLQLVAPGIYRHYKGKTFLVLGVRRVVRASWTGFESYVVDTVQFEAEGETPFVTFPLFAESKCWFTPGWVNGTSVIRFACTRNMELSELLIQ